MPRIEHIYDPAERFVVGTVGQPGERTFFVQVRSAQRLISVALEKSQVNALCQRIEMMIREVKKDDPGVLLERVSRDDAPLETPIFEEFRVGMISLSWLRDRRLLCIELHAINEEDSQSEEAIFQLDNENRDLVKVFISLSQADAFSTRAVAVIKAGRLPCPFCAIPIDPTGHLCPRANGYRR